jgi:DNA-binding beta-propeller fold protein YncE
MIQMKRSIGWVTGTALGGLLLGFVCGCAQVESRDEILRAWPPPPAEPRIALRRMIHSAKDFEKADFFSGLGRLIAGGRQQTLLRPQAIVLDDQQRLYIADQEHQGVHVFDLKEGKARFFDQAGKEFFVSPAGLAWCEGNLLVADSFLNRVFVLSPDGKLLRTINRPEGFRRPTGIAYDAPRRLLYIVDTTAHQVCVFKATGEFLHRFGASGTGPGLFNYPTYVAVDKDGTIYVTDSLNFRVQVFDPQEKFVREIGNLGDATGFMAVPKGVAIDSQGHRYVADSSLAIVQIFDREGRFLLAVGERGDGPGAFQIPTGLAIGPENKIYVCDAFGRRLQIFQYMEAQNEISDD